MSIIGGVSQQNTNIIIDGSSVKSQEAASQAPELKAGATIQGTVVSITDTSEGKIATINVGDAAISAKLQDGMGLREGQTLNFNVRSVGQGGVSITPLYENTSIDQSTLKALTAAGIEINNDTIQMVKDMMSASLPINKDALVEMNKSLSSYPNTSVTTLVEMKSLNIPIDDKNIAQFESYKNYEHQVTSTMESIIDEMPSAFSELMASGKETEALDLYGSVLKLFGNEIEASDEGAAIKEQAPISSALVDAEEVIQEQNPETAAKASANADPKEVLENTTNPEQSPGALSDKFVENLKSLGISDKAINTYNEVLKETATVNIAENPEQAAKLEDAQKALLKELSKAFEEADLKNSAESTAWKNIFSNKDYTRLLKDNMSSQWHLKPLDVEHKENIDNLYQRLSNQAKGLTEAINQNLGAESKLAQSANNLQNNLDFMNQLNQMFQYVQLPLQMAGQNVHGDLYVYRNKNKKMSEDGSVSAALHLDMENLGPVDVYVKLLDTKVTTNFYVADDSVIDLINDNIHILNERLEKRGYTMNATLKLHDDMDGQDAAVDEMLSVSKTPILSTNSFDARA
ncbi:flagellar hook-length control protein FliK [Butyrivibrio sp. CB08]|uniref:flagellar hook-length control protein FliK n=1 Tax=Butyrivibrio sp. CB08 TaxID=2364879 RepID=UPI000EA842B7|nr:flagellar hook-length control protein FliK [Butyrivibrio sp. CB08]RKM57502.1 flagellar hook-length control protein FliK [Butyrivibrio sp. CB08]